MTSMRTLNRRLLRWRRYARRTCWNPRVSRPRGWGADLVLPPGMVRAWDAQQAERQRRLDAAYDPYPNGECYCAGCVGVGPCENEPGYDEDGCGSGVHLVDCDRVWDDDEWGEEYWDAPPDRDRPPAIVTIDPKGLL